MIKPDSLYKFSNWLDFSLDESHGTYYYEDGKVDDLYTPGSESGEQDDGKCRYIMQNSMKITFSICVMVCTVILLFRVSTAFQSQRSDF